MAGRLLPDDPELALQHAQQAHDLSPRITAVREALAVVGYQAGDYKAALREARTVRRMTGDESWLPMIADCERGLGRSDRALDLLAEVDLGTLPDEIRAECLIVRSGARRDLGQPEAALAALETDLLRVGRKAVWVARLRIAYAETLLALGRSDEAERWLRLAVASDPTGESGAADLLADWEGVDLLEDEPAVAGEITRTADDAASPA